MLILAEIGPSVSRRQRRFICPFPARLRLLVALVMMATFSWEYFPAGPDVAFRRDQCFAALGSLTKVRRRPLGPEKIGWRGRRSGGAGNVSRRLLNSSLNWRSVKHAHVAGPG